MAFNLGAILSLLVAFQFSFMSVYLFSNKKGNRRNNSLLGILFAMFAVNLLDFTARISGMVFPVPLLHFFDDTFFLFYGPVLFYYTQAVVYRDFKFSKSNIWHFIPGLAISLNPKSWTKPTRCSVFSRPYWNGILISHPWNPCWRRSMSRPRPP